MLKFKKMHGLGNDFIILDLRDGKSLPDKSVIAKMTHRKFGVGCDQFIPVFPPEHPKADAFMRILNAPDASEAEACGNATRCVADFLMRESGKDYAVIHTVAGFLECRRTENGMVEVDMGVPSLNWQDIPLSHDMDTRHIDLAVEGCDLPSGTAVNIGNPHCVLFFDDAEALDIECIGPKVEHHPFFTARTNVEFVSLIEKNRLRMRVWERDTGVTMACGSAACATAVAAIEHGLTDRKVEVMLDGGPLFFEWREQDRHLLMTGPVTYVYDGMLSDDFS